MAWGELVQFEVTFFDPGDHPWTMKNFWDHSIEQEKAPHTVDPIVVEDFWGEPRVAENTGWWEWGLWWTPNSAQELDLDQNHKLTHRAIKFDVYPLLPGHQNLLQEELSMIGGVDTFGPWLDDLKLLAEESLREGTHSTSFLTLWVCDAWRSEDTWCGPGEYEHTYELVGTVHPKVNTVIVKKLEGK